MSQWQSLRSIWLSSSLQLESLKTGTAAQASGMAAHYFKEAPKRAHFLLREYASHLNNQSQAAGSFLNRVCNRGCMYHYFSENFLFLDLLNLQDFFPSPRDEKLKMRNRVNVPFHIIFFVFFFLLFLGRVILSSL